MKPKNTPSEISVTERVYQGAVLTVGAYLVRSMILAYLEGQEPNMESDEKADIEESSDDFKQVTDLPKDE